MNPFFKIEKEWCFFFVFLHYSAVIRQRFCFPEGSTGDRIPTRRTKTGTARRSPHAVTTLIWLRVMRRLCDASLTGTEGHLHGVNKGNSALHHNHTHKKTTIQEAWNATKFGVSLKRSVSLYHSPLDWQQNKLVNSTFPECWKQKTGWVTLSPSFWWRVFALLLTQKTELMK